LENFDSFLSYSVRFQAGPDLSDKALSMKETSMPQPSPKLCGKQRNMEILQQSNGRYTNEHQHINEEQNNAHSACPRSLQSSVPAHIPYKTNDPKSLGNADIKLNSN